MLTVTITNLSASVPIGVGTATYPTPDVVLPAPFDGIAIAVSSSATTHCRVQDILAPAERLSGFTVADALQQMVQSGIITVAFANLAATLQADAGGDAISNES